MERAKITTLHSSLGDRVRFRLKKQTNKKRVSTKNISSHHINSKILNASPEVRNKTRLYIITTSSQHYTNSPIQCNHAKKKKKMEGIETEKE